jgi:hypothetical protein
MGVALCLACSTGCTKSEQDPAAQLSAADKQKMTEMSKQAQLNVMSARINNSNLTPEQKQRLLEQVRGSNGK